MDYWMIFEHVAVLFSVGLVLYAYWLCIKGSWRPSFEVKRLDYEWDKYVKKRRSKE